MEDILKTINGYKMQLLIQIIINVLFFSTLFGFEAVGEAANAYYISASYGNDVNDGLSVSTPWKTISKVNAMSYNPGDKILFRRGEAWRGQLIPHSGDETGYVIYGAYGTGVKPVLLGSIRRNSANDWTHERDNIWMTSGIPVDVGNLIFNNESSVGVKVRTESELDTQGEFWYDEANFVLKIYSRVNPAMHYSNIECALKKHIINESGRSYVMYENLALRYGGAHGIGGTNVHHIIVRDSDFSYIGGGRQSGEVRYGNGIEFWNSAHDTTVERCRLWEIYDAALTTQGAKENKKYNQTFTHNVVWNSEYCFEYWNRPDTSTTNNIFFENNTCVNAGHGWGHDQRWRETDAGWHNGRHLAIYNNSARTANFYIRNNIFYRARNALYSIYTVNSFEKLIIDGNVLSQPAGIMIVYCADDTTCDQYSMNQFAAYQVNTGQDKHSLADNPLFIDEGKNDYRPVRGSPVCTLSETESFAGALPCIGNNYPLSNFRLLFPLSNQSGLGTVVTFNWESSMSSEGYPVMYTLFICEDDSFTVGCIDSGSVLSIISEEINKKSLVAGLLLFGLIIPGSIKRTKRILLLPVICIIAVLILVSCGGSDESGNINHSSSNEITHRVSGLKRNTMYFWKVVASDNNGGTSESEIRRFTTR